MLEANNRKKDSSPSKEDYAAWMRRLLKTALDGGPQVVSARAIATSYGGLGERESQADGVIRDARRGLFARSELQHVATLLSHEGIVNGDEAQRIALARWFVHARLATAIALVYGHDPEQEWVQAAILVSIDRTPVQEELDREQEQQGSTIWEGAFQLFGDVVLALILAKIGARLHGQVKSKSVRLLLLAGVRKVFRAAGQIGLVHPLVAIRNARRCRKTGRTAQRIFRFRGLPSTTEKALTH